MTNIEYFEREVIRKKQAKNRAEQMGHLREMHDLEVKIGRLQAAVDALRTVEKMNTTDGWEG